MLRVARWIDERWYARPLRTGGGEHAAAIQTHIAGAGARGKEADADEEGISPLESPTAGLTEIAYVLSFQLMMIPRIIVDTSVLASAFTSGRGASREILRRVLREEARALISVPLFVEYEDVLARPQLQQRCSLSLPEQVALLDAFLACTKLVEVYYRWRPNLPDESDNHVLELAVAAGSATILTFNRRDFTRGELRFPDIAIQSPAGWLKELKK